MPDLYDLWEAVSTLKASLPFAIALPILVALVFASIADWLERRLTTDQAAASRDWADSAATSAKQHRRWGFAWRRRSLLTAGDRNRKHA
jgi:hypothetical protein